MIIIIMGVAGSGKTTIGELLAHELSWPFYEGDTFHSAANIEKMARALPLSDADRAPWLTALAQLIGELDQKSRAAVIACSALKQSYREALKGQSSDVRFVYLKGSYELVLKRIQSRREHFMKADLLKSQFQILEEPEQAVVVDIVQEPIEIIRRIRQELGF